MICQASSQLWWDVLARSHSHSTRWCKARLWLHESSSWPQIWKNNLSSHRLLKISKTGLWSSRIQVATLKLFYRLLNRRRRRRETIWFWRRLISPRRATLLAPPKPEWPLWVSSFCLERLVIPECRTQVKTVETNLDGLNAEAFTQVLFTKKKGKTLFNASVSIQDSLCKALCHRDHPGIVRANHSLQPD